MDALTFDESKARLEEIADLVEDPDISLDDALVLYEEAVKIGLHACDVSEQDLLATSTAEADDPSQAAESADAMDAAQDVPEGTDGAEDVLALDVSGADGATSADEDGLV